MKTIQLKPKKEIALKRGHLWIFSGAISTNTSDYESGSLVEVIDSKQNFLAIGHFFNGGSIACRVLTFKKEHIDEAFWNKRIHQALSNRQSLIENAHTNAFRLAHGEGDFLPGLIIDYYNGTAVVQTHTTGMANSLPEIKDALLSQNQLRIDHIFDKSENLLKDGEYENQFLHGGLNEDVVEENGHKFLVNWTTGQKTGFFLDQRDNRQLLKSLVKGKTVLNLFCYTGGFTIYALAGGAAQVTSVDVSKSAIDILEKNIKLNGFDENKHESLVEDVMKLLKTHQKTYDIIIVDPPAFAKSLKKRHQAVTGYKRLNSLAMQKLNPGGILMSYSCSHAVDEKLFLDTLAAAAIEENLSFQVFKKLGAGMDHPYLLQHQESSYLKGFLLTKIGN